jgi:hypothetical protein
MSTPVEDPNAPAGQQAAPAAQATVTTSLQGERTILMTPENLAYYAGEPEQTVLPIQSPLEAEGEVETDWFFGGSDRHWMSNEESFDEAKARDAQTWKEQEIVNLPFPVSDMTGVILRVPTASVITHSLLMPGKCCSWWW